MGISKRELGRRIGCALEDAGLTSTEVAAALGFSDAAVRHWIKGRNAVPAGVIPDLARLTNKAITFFLDITDADQELIPSHSLPNDRKIRQLANQLMRQLEKQGITDPEEVKHLLNLAIVFALKMQKQGHHVEPILPLHPTGDDSE